MRMISLVMILGVFLGACSSDKKAPKLDTQSTEERENSIKKGFSTDVKSSEEELEEVAKNAFRYVRKAYASRKAEIFFKVFSCSQLLAYLEQDGTINPSKREVGEFVRGIEKGLANNIRQVQITSAMENMMLVSVQKVGDEQFIAYSSSWMPELATYQKMRWWFVKDDDGKWKIFDYEDFSSNLRVTTAMRTMIQSGLLDQPAWFKPMTEMMSLARSAQMENMAQQLSAMVEPIKKLLESSAPDEIKFVAHLFYIQHAFIEEDLVIIEKHLKEMKKIDPRSPAVYYNEVIFYQYKEEFQKSLTSLEHYEELLGRDSEVCTLYSDVYLAQGENAKAIEVLEEALSLNNQDQLAMVNYALVIDKSKWEQIAEKLEKLTNAQDIYWEVVAGAWERKDQDRMDWFIERFKKNYPNATDYSDEMEDLKNYVPE